MSLGARCIVLVSQLDEQEACAGLMSYNKALIGHGCGKQGYRFVY
jgi:hypothetical protein